MLPPPNATALLQVLQAKSTEGHAHSLPHCGYVSGFVGVTSTVPGSMASVSQPISLAPPNHQPQICDCPVTSQVLRHPLYFSEGSGCPCLSSKDRSPADEGCDRAGPSSRYEVRILQPLLHCTQERRWAKANLESAHLEPGPSQASVQDTHAETHLRVRLSPKLVCSNRPEGRILPCVDHFVPQAIPAVCVRRTGISVQGLALRAVPVALCLHESCGRSPCSLERNLHSQSGPSSAPQRKHKYVLQLLPTYTHTDQLDAIIACQCALAHLVYTRSGLVSLSEIPICRSSDMTSPFPPSGNEGYIRNWDVLGKGFKKTTTNISLLSGLWDL